ncbi:hypothetical protein ACFL3D_03370, partial [Candidatus Omnitrophota bacterium]
MLNKHKKLIYALLFIGIITLALFLRTWNLGKFGFWHDELYHVLAAKGIVETGAPVIPPGYEYTRALGYTQLVAGLFKLFGISEGVARIPSIFFDLLLLIISFYIVYKLFDRHHALLYLFIMTISPMNVYLARSCRMYTIFQLYYFLGAITFFIGFEPSCVFCGERSKKKNGLDVIPKFRTFVSNWEEKYDVRFIFILLSLLFFIVSLKMHLLTANFIFVLVFYCVMQTLLLLKREGVHKALRSKYGGMLFIMSLICVISGLIYRAKILSLASVALGGLEWDKYVNYSIHTFRWVFTENYSLLFFLYPIAIWYLIKKQEKLGVFLLGSFAVLFV